MPRTRPEAGPSDEFDTAMVWFHQRGRRDQLVALWNRRRQRRNNRSVWEAIEVLRILAPKTWPEVEKEIAAIGARPEQLALVDGDGAVTGGRPEPRNDEERTIVAVMAEYPDGGRVGYIVNDLCDAWGWDASDDGKRRKALGKANGAAQRGLIRLSRDENFFFPVLTAEEAARYERTA